MFKLSKYLENCPEIYWALNFGKCLENLKKFKPFENSRSSCSILLLYSPSPLGKIPVTTA